ncbi:DUF445 domain-containing protein [Desulfosporosinus sp. Sb-LF]|uniref:DUF445 domain-containing protein n=1 Tax=Desulfosporosinus sp. Sb-LF TaxID=2560027 RepID=UPI00107FCA42|nr:DUF445 domain-containing protein [Desulfosporosinus sp. Sb-LF]TGE33846.1 DUF445 domain-containing protein [Desulfosporosinus sp. Sb-LF]
MVKKRNNTQSANLTLGGITLGFLLSYPFHTSFVGGLISSGCTAGMIGGLADWFAVTALFRRPLGIRPGKVLRTEIIPQNRERIYAALADMVQHELLSQDVLKRKLSAWNLSGVLIRIFAEQDVREAVSLLLANLAEDIEHHVEPDKLKQQIRSVVEENVHSLNLSRTLAEIVEFSLAHGDVDQALTVICRTFYEFMDQPLVSGALTEMIEAALMRYGDNNPTRKIIGKFLPSPEILAKGLQEKVKITLQDGTVERWLKDSLLRLTLELKTNSSLQERLNAFIIQALNGSTVKAFEIQALIEKFFSNLEDNWDGYLEKLERNLDLRQKMDEGIKQILEKQIAYHHNAIGRMVREGLDPLTDETLVELIEDKAGNDLQMIRINGSVVGGLVGVLIYVLGVVLRS